MTLARRLLVVLLVAVPLMWGVAVGAAYSRSRQEINELFDTQQVVTPPTPEDCTSDTRVQAGKRPTPGSFSAGRRKSMPATRPSRLISMPSSRASVRPNRPATESW